jgi:CheY-like chemotaxis protein
MTGVARETKRVFVVDDEPGVIDLVTAMLAGGAGDYDWAIDIADSGEKALDACRREPPDVLILDVRMHGMDGFETCRLLKDDARTAGIWIVMLTAFAQEIHMRRSYAAGADAYLAKPFTIDQLVRALRPAA